MIEVSDTKTRILAKAHELQQQYGIRSVSMDDIAAKLGISKKTIYQYYADKDDLIMEVVQREIANSELSCQVHVDRSDNAVHQVFLAMDFTKELIKNMNPSMLYDLQKYHPKAFTKFQQHKNSYLYGIIKENIERGIAEEVYRADINVEIITRFRLETMMLSFSSEFLAKLKNNREDIEEELILHFLHGLASAKGQKLITKYKQERLKK